MLPLLLAFWAAFGLALISPGPNFAVMLSTALRQGRAAAVWVALGVAIGEAAWGFAAVFGVAALASSIPGSRWRSGSAAACSCCGWRSCRCALPGAATMPPVGHPTPAMARRRSAAASGAAWR